MVLLLYTTYTSVDLAHREIFRVGKGSINGGITLQMRSRLIDATKCHNTLPPIYLSLSNSR